ncbi:MAG: DUF6175 family protein [Candidatus Omnitrophota bacterium]
MRRRIIRIIFLVCSLCIASRVLSQVHYIDEKIVSLTALGYGKDVGDTKLNAMKSGVEAIVRDMLSTPDERAKFDRQRNAFLMDADKYVSDFTIKRKIEQKGIHNGEKYHLTMMLEMNVNKEQIQQSLEAQHIVVTSSELRKSLDNFTIMPYVDEKKSSPAFSEKKDIAYARIGSFLQSQHIPFIGEEEIKNIESNEEVIALEKSSSAQGGEDDILIQLARNTRADFYIKIVGHVEETPVEGVPCVKVSASITVYTVMTGENMASQTGFSRLISLSSKENSIAAGIEEAVNSAMPDIMNRMRQFWKDYVKDGRPYKLVFYDFNFNELAGIRQALNELSPQIKLHQKIGNLTAFIVWYKGPLDTLLFEVPGRIDLKLKEDPVILGNTLRFFKNLRKK